MHALRENQLDAEILALHVHDRRRLCYRASKGSKSSVPWVTAWPSPAASMPPGSLCTMAAWVVGEGPPTHTPHRPAAASHRLATAEQGEGVCLELVLWERERERRRPRAWSGPARDRPVFGGGASCELCCALLGQQHSPCTPIWAPDTDTDTDYRLPGVITSDFQG
jgi:hypothetical protein